MKIACLIPGGLGGTQKAAWSYAEGLAGRGHDVTAYSGLGPFVPPNPQPTMNIRLAPETVKDLHEICRNGFDALHLHVPGYFTGNPLYRVLKSFSKKEKPRVVETNVFGWLKDYRADSVTDIRLFISMTSAWQAARRAGRRLRGLERCNVARYPVGLAPRGLESDRKRLRQELGYRDSDVIAVRLGRPDPAKWTDHECQAVMRARKNGAQNLKFLAIEPPHILRKMIQEGRFGDGIKAAELMSDPAKVAALLDASDLILHTARFGESFGYAIAEGMAAGKAVITRTTPWGDNAQIELVEHGGTGFVTSSLEGTALALQLMVGDPGLRMEMGAAGRDRIKALSDPEQETRILESALLGDSQKLQDRWDDVLEFGETLPCREWNVIEVTHPNLLKNSRDVLRREKGYASRYRMKKRLSVMRADLRSFLGYPAYR